MLFFCMTAITHSQDTTGFLSFFGRESATWHSSVCSFDVCEGGLLNQGTDTIIEGIEYKKAEYSIADRWNSGEYIEMRYEEFDIFLREDTRTGRLWCRFPDIFPERHPWTGEELSHEELIVDMTLSIGDTFEIFLLESLEYASYIVVDTMIINHRRTIILKGPCDDQIKFIEGVGCTNMFLYSRFDQNYANLRCCHKDGELVYHWRSSEDDTDCVPLDVGIENHENRQAISVYPNPCTDKLWIDGDNILSASLFDIKGNKIIASISKNQSLDMSTLPQGVYILRLVSNVSVPSKIIIKE